MLPYFDPISIPMALTSVAYFRHPSYLVHLSPHQQLLPTSGVASLTGIAENLMDSGNNGEMALSCPINGQVAVMGRGYLRNYAPDLAHEHPTFKGE